jgi:hypothetical protein
VRTELLLEHPRGAAREANRRAVVEAAERLRGPDGIELANPALHVKARAV